MLLPPPLLLPLLLLPSLLLLPPPVSSSQQKVAPDYLRRGTRRYYFNSCECGHIDGQEQDLKWVVVVGGGGIGFWVMMQ